MTQSIEFHDNHEMTKEVLESKQLLPQISNTTSSDLLIDGFKKKYFQEVHPSELKFYKCPTIDWNLYLDGSKNLWLYCFLKYGLIIYKSGLNCSQLKSVSKIYSIANDILNKQANHKSTTISVNPKTIRNYKSPLTQHTEVIYRTNKEGTELTCTLDISLKYKSLYCDYISKLFENLEIVNQLKEFYSTINDQNELHLCNWGFFVSPEGNIGQELHVDDFYLKNNANNTQLPEMITLLLTITKNAIFKSNNIIKNNGSTNFILKSMHPLKCLQKLKHKLHNVRIISNPADIIIFGGQLLHAGGPHNIVGGGERIVGYAVYGTQNHIKKSKNHDEFCTCWKCREDYTNFLIRHHSIVNKNGEWVCNNRIGNTIFS